MSDKKKVILWGSGGRGIKLLYRLCCDKREVSYVVDKNMSGEFRGIPIVNDITTIPDWRKYDIVIATLYNPYKEIKEMLSSLDCVEFEDFIWGDLYGKKLCVLHGNCHIRVLKQYLSSCKEFMEVYGIYPLPEIQNMDSNGIDENILKHADLFIHQDIRDNNAYGFQFSDTYILPKLSKECQQVCVPNVYGMGGAFFPGSGDVNGVSLSNGKLMGIFYKNDIIDKAYQNIKTKKLDDLLEFIAAYEFPEGFIENEFKKMMNKIHSREKNWDVKISSFILENYKRIPIFRDKNHASDELMDEICRQLLVLCGIKRTPNLHQQSILGLEEDVFEDVKEKLQLEYKKGLLRQKDSSVVLCGEHGEDYREYLKEYIWFFYNEIWE